MAAQENFLKSLTERDFISRVSQFPNDFVNPDIGLTTARFAGAGYPDLVTREITDNDFMPEVKQDPLMTKPSKNHAPKGKNKISKKGGVSKKRKRLSKGKKGKNSQNKRKRGGKKLKRLYKKKRNCKRSSHFHKIKSNFI